MVEITFASYPSICIFKKIISSDKILEKLLLLSEGLFKKLHDDVYVVKGRLTQILLGPLFTFSDEFIIRIFFLTVNIRFR